MCTELFRLLYKLQQLLTVLASQLNIMYNPNEKSTNLPRKQIRNSYLLLIPLVRKVEQLLMRD